MSASEDASAVAVVDTDAALYERLSPERNEFLDRARENAKFTIPALMPPDGHTPGAALYRPHQSIGAFGVNTLTAKIVSTIMPPNSPIFRYLVTDKVVEDLAEDSRARSAVEKKFNEIERAVQDEVEGLAIRDSLTNAIRQLIVCGNVLLYLPKNGGLRVFRLDQYVVQRDSSGNILRVIIKEKVSIEALPQHIRALVEAQKEGLPSEEMANGVNEKELDLYTVFYRDQKRLRTYQSIKGIKIKQSRGSWPIKKSPLMALRWSSQPGEDYGRGYVDDYIGDITAVEYISEHLRQGVAASVKFNPMVNPAGLTRAEDIAKSENLEVIAGRADDVTMLQFDKQADLRVAQEFLNDIIQRLSHAFMMNKSIQRDAERVTAEEIRALVADLEAVLGGVYALLAQDLQLPLVTRVMDRMVAQKLIPDVSKIKDPNTGRPAAPVRIVTGVEAMGRGNDFNKLMTLGKEVLFPLAEAGMAEVNISDYIRRAAVALGIDTDGLIKTAEDKQADMQKKQGAMSQQMLMDAVKSASGPVAKVAAEGMASQAAPEQTSE
ncbi:portal protein [uncultured Cohaesibacter sp.]|uniref:portal protein n=1 Tax=uncultured Cohaesibacter sp. TaxID=1002546 RepID=UPI0029C6817C|nr:portal protein [uncultured Cohaesibacter sp.]